MIYLVKHENGWPFHINEISLVNIKYDLAMETINRQGYNLNFDSTYYINVDFKGNKNETYDKIMFVLNSHSEFKREISINSIIN